MCGRRAIYVPPMALYACNIRTTVISGTGEDGSMDAIRYKGRTRRIPSRSCLEKNGTVATGQLVLPAENSDRPGCAAYDNHRVDA